MLFTYILKSLKTGRYYTGVTSDLEVRLSQHNSGQTKSTKNRGPWAIVHTEDFSTLGEALKRERYLKSGRGRDELKKILANILPSHNSEGASGSRLPESSC
jgi:putative endonuclease